MTSTDIGHWGKYSLSQVLKEEEILPPRGEKDLPDKGISTCKRTDVRNKNHDAQGKPTARAQQACWGGWRARHS